MLEFRFFQLSCRVASDSFAAVVVQVRCRDGLSNTHTRIEKAILIFLGASRQTGWQTAKAGLRKRKIKIPKKLKKSPFPRLTSWIPSPPCALCLVEPATLHSSSLISKCQKVGERRQSFSPPPILRLNNSVGIEQGCLLRMPSSLTAVCRVWTGASWFLSGFRPRMHKPLHHHLPAGKGQVE